MRLLSLIPARLLRASDRRLSGWLRARANVAYERGRFHTALRLWLRGACVGDAECQFHVGELFERGEGVFGNQVESAVWYRRAADSGHAEARFRIGRLLLHGAAIGLPDRWLRTTRDPNAAAAVSDALLPQGGKLEADPQAAVGYLELAAQAGVAEASSLLGN